MREARGNGKENLEGKRPRNNPRLPVRISLAHWLKSDPAYTHARCKQGLAAHVDQICSHFVSFLKTIVEIKPKLRDLGTLS